MPFDFGDSTSVDFARALKEATEHRHRLAIDDDTKNSDSKDEIKVSFCEFLRC
jgi:hypothetical protein